MWPFTRKPKPEPKPPGSVLQQVARSQVIILDEVDTRWSKGQATVCLSSRDLAHWLCVSIDGPRELALHLGAKVRVTIEPIEDVPEAVEG